MKQKECRRIRQKKVGKITVGAPAEKPGLYGTINE
jgi:hypothetical protein